MKVYLFNLKVLSHLWIFSEDGSLVNLIIFKRIRSIKESFKKTNRIECSIWTRPNTRSMQVKVVPQLNLMLDDRSDLKTNVSIDSCLWISSRWTAWPPCGRLLTTEPTGSKKFNFQAKILTKISSPRELFRIMQTVQLFRVESFDRSSAHWAFRRLEHVRTLHDALRLVNCEWSKSVGSGLAFHCNHPKPNLRSLKRFRKIILLIKRCRI